MKLKLTDTWPQVKPEHCLLQPWKQDNDYSFPSLTVSGPTWVRLLSYGDLKALVEPTERRGWFWEIFTPGGIGYTSNFSGVEVTPDLAKAKADQYLLKMGYRFLDLKHVVLI